MQDDPKTPVSTEWLAKHLNDPDLRIMDASWHMPASGRDGRAEYNAAHIPGARFFDIAKGKKNVDKRETSDERDWNRQKQRLLKQGG